MSETRRATLRLETYQDHNSRLVRFVGQLTLPACDWTFAQLESTLASHSAATYFALQDLDYLDSSGLALLIRANARMLTRGKSLVLLTPSYKVLRIFSVSRVEAIFKIKANADAEQIIGQLMTPDLLCDQAECADGEEEQRMAG
jgi:anti-anti-sigma factor